MKLTIHDKMSKKEEATNNQTKKNSKTPADSHYKNGIVQKGHKS